MKNKFTIVKIVDYNLDGEEEYVRYKVNFSWKTNGDYDIHEKYMNKTFSSYEEARKYIRIHDGI